MATDAPEQVHDLTPADLIECRARRLMATRAGLALTWETRQRRAELFDEIEDEIDEWLKVRP